MAIHPNTTGSSTPRDPVTNAPDFHPVGTGVGAAAGGVAAGAAVGSVAGPVGTAIGAAAGAIVGGLAGKAVAHHIDAEVEDAYWHENFSREPYVTSGDTYDDYGPAYRYGVSSYETYQGRPFNVIESDLGRDWDNVRGRSSLTWDKAKHATRAAWERITSTIERAVPGDADRDGL